MDLPGISVLVGGMWIMNLSYWGFNQYIIQRALAAKSTQEAQKGIMFAAFLKMLMPLIIVLPGVAAVILAPELNPSDKAYPTVMNLLARWNPWTGIRSLDRGNCFITGFDDEFHIDQYFTMDLYRHFATARDKSEKQLVNRRSAGQPDRYDHCAHHCQAVARAV